METVTVEDLVHPIHSRLEGATVVPSVLLTLLLEQMVVLVVVLHVVEEGSTITTEAVEVEDFSFEFNSICSKNVY